MVTDITYQKRQESMIAVIMILFMQKILFAFNCYQRQAAIETETVELIAALIFANMCSSKPRCTSQLYFSKCYYRLQIQLLIML